MSNDTLDQILSQSWYYLQREVNQASITYLIKSGKPLTVAFGIIKGGVEFR